MTNTCTDIPTFVVGLTGGIASGKSTAAKFFRALGVVVIDSDQIARDVVATGSKGLAKIIERYGHQILQADGGLDRAKLRTIVFKDEEERQWLNALTHPLIRERSEYLISQPYEYETANYRVMEIPLLFESSRHRDMHRTLLIDVDTEEQIQRIMARDNSNKEQAIAIINAQMPVNEKRKLADDIIENIDCTKTLEEKIEKQHQFYQQLSQTHNA